MLGATQENKCDSFEDDGNSLIGCDSEFGFGLHDRLSRQRLEEGHGTNIARVVCSKHKKTKADRSTLHARRRRFG